jgi:hypothetical protein
VLPAGSASNVGQGQGNARPVADASGSDKPAEITPELLRSAFKHFKKRIKLTRLDEESGMTRRPLTSGQKSDVAAILPPGEYPRAVWDELVKQGRLKYRGGGFYELAGGPQKEW